MTTRSTNFRALQASRTISMQKDAAPAVAYLEAVKLAKEPDRDRMLMDVAERIARSTDAEGEVQQIVEQFLQAPLDGPGPDPDPTGEIEAADGVGKEDRDMAFRAKAETRTPDEVVRACKALQRVRARSSPRRTPPRC